MSATNEDQSSKKLNELKVNDLKSQLEKRGLEKTGVKPALIERLKKAIAEEGYNPDDFQFEVSSEVKKTRQSEEEEEDMDTSEATAVNTSVCENGEVAQTSDQPSSTDDQSPSDKKEVAEGEVPEVQSAANTAVTSSSEMDKTPEDQDTMESIDDILDGDFVELDGMPNFVLDEDEDEDGILEGDVEMKGDAEQKAAEGSVEPVKATDGTKQTTAANPQSSPAPDDKPPAQNLATLTKENVEGLEGAGERKNEDDISLIVHVDESANDLDNDILDTTKDGQATSPPSTTQKTPTEQTKPDSAPATVQTSTDTPKAKEQGTEVKGKDSQQITEEKKTDTSKATVPKPAVSSSGLSSKVDESGVKKEEPKPEPKKPVNVTSRNLWVSGLSSTTKATDLKTIFTKYGKVAGAKVVTNARSPGARCYGFITMSTADEATKCIHHLHKTELHGRMISVERAKNDPSAQSKLAAAKKPGTVVRTTAPTTKMPDKKEVDGAGEKSETPAASKKDVGRVERSERPRGGEMSRRYSGDSGRSRAQRPSDHPRHAPHHSDRGHSPRREHSRQRSDTAPRKEGAPEEAADDAKKQSMLDFEKIREERERERIKQRQRERREEERRKMRVMEEERRNMRVMENERMRQREIEMRQRDESRRLERERERLRVEKARLEEERIESERQRILLERERQQRERERLERAREAEKRQDLIRKRDEVNKRAVKRSYEPRVREEQGGWTEPKRASLPESRDRSGDRATEARRHGEFTRRVEHVSRRENRDAGGGGDTARFDNHHESHPPRVVRRETSGSRPTRSSPDRRETKYERPRYDERRAEHPSSNRETERGGREVVARHSSPPRHTAPIHRSQDSRAEWKESRTVATSRDIRDSGGRYSGGGMASTQNMSQGTWHNRPVGSTNVSDDRNKTRGPPSYNTGPGLLGSVPGGADQWQRGATDRPVSSHPPPVNTRPPPERGVWAPAAVTPVDRLPRVSVPPVMNNPQVVHVPAASSSFLTSAANIMMGVGMTGDRGQEVRYDAYKQASGGNMRRY